MLCGSWNTMYKITTPTGLSMPIMAVCLTSGIIRIANGTNMPLTMYRYANL